MDKESRQLFEQILTQLTQYQEQQAPPGVDAQKETQAITSTTSERIAAGLVTGIWSRAKSHTHTPAHPLQSVIKVVYIYDQLIFTHPLID